MTDRFSRTRLLLGAENMEKLKKARVAIFGIGGVGSYAAEALCRGGIGGFALFDSDRVSLSNINRQITALSSTVGRLKAEVMKERMLDINPDTDITVYPCFYLPQNAGEYPLDSYSYIIDAVDTVTAKIEIITRAKAAGIPVISCMGAGNKLDPAGFEVADIAKTSVCPLAKVMRRELRLRGIEHLKVVYSKEPPAAVKDLICGGGGDSAISDNSLQKRQIPGSVSFVPSAAGLIAAGEVIRDLTGIC